MTSGVDHDYGPLFMVANVTFGNVRTQVLFCGPLRTPSSASLIPAFCTACSYQAAHVSLTHCQLLSQHLVYVAIYRYPSAYLYAGGNAEQHRPPLLSFMLLVERHDKGLKLSIYAVYLEVPLRQRMNATVEKSALGYLIS